MAEKILVVDDDPASVRLVEGILKNENYNVSSAQDGLDALVKIKNENPQLVVLDVMLPEINGYDICYQLRFNKEFEKIPIVLMTSREQEMDNAIGKRVNIDYVHKPVDSKLLIDKIRLLLHLPKARK